MEYFDFKSIPDRMNLENLPLPRLEAQSFTRSIIPDRFPFLLHQCAAGEFASGSRSNIHWTTNSATDHKVQQVEKQQVGNCRLGSNFTKSFPPEHTTTSVWNSR